MSTSRIIYIIHEESYEHSEPKKAYATEKKANEVCDSKNRTNTNKYIWYKVKQAPFIEE